MWRQRYWAVIALMVLTAVCCGTNWHVELKRSSGGRISHGDELIADIMPGLHLEGWRRREMAVYQTPSQPGRLCGAVVRDGVHVTSELASSRPDGQSILLDYCLMVHQDVRLSSLHVSFMFPVGVLLGHGFSADGGDWQTFPQTFSRETKHFFRGKVSEMAVRTSRGVLRWRFRSPVNILFQDNRNWGDTFCLRVMQEREADALWRAGESFAFAVEVSFPDEVTLAEASLHSFRAGADWVPLDYRPGVKAGSALDFSVLGQLDAPAGKYGRVKAVGRHFEFERLPGRSQRFYGVNLVGGANAPSHEEALELAERFSRQGYNSVRYHHYANAVFRPEKGCSTALDPVKMERFDFLFAEMKRRGFYATTDVFSSRGVFASEIWDDGKNELLDFRQFRPLLAHHPKALENVKAFARNFFLHRNPYTGLTYAEEPSLAWICMVNEGNFQPANDGSRIAKVWTEAWNRWLGQRYASPQARNDAWKRQAPETLALMPSETQRSTPREYADFEQFMVDSETRLYHELATFMREELGCQALFTSINHSWLTARGAMVRREFDYVDTHFYVDHPVFPGKRWSLPSYSQNLNLVRAGRIGGTDFAFGRLWDRPYTITEFNYSAPGQYRGVGGILTGCLGAQQDWAGIWRFAYMHGRPPLNRPRRIGYFDTQCDPLNQAADRATVCLYLRGDMQPLRHSVLLTLSPDCLTPSFRLLRGTLVPEWLRMSSLAQVGIAVTSKDNRSPQADVVLPLLTTGAASASPLGEEGYQTILKRMDSQRWLPADNRTRLRGFPVRVESPSGQFLLDAERGLAFISTPRTAGGFAPAGSAIITNGLQADIRDTEATLWASSVDGQPLSRSRRILLTHLTDLQNDGVTFEDAQRRQLVSWGSLPHIMRQGRATVTLRHQFPQRLKAWVLRTDGERLAPWPMTVTSDGDGFRLELSVRGAHGAQMLYEIADE